MFARLTDRVLWLLLGAYVALAISYAWATPLLEASDEYVHFGMVQYVAENWQLPVQRPGEQTPWLQQASQPPLYYMLAGLVMGPFDLSDAESLRVFNPHMAIGQPDSYRNKNYLVHAEPYPPLQGTTLGLVVLRGMSIVLGLVTVTGVYLAGYIVSGRRRIVGLIAAGLVAFNPMFLFISASVNNDNLVTALSSIATVLALLTLRDGFDTRRSLLLAVVIALATLSKLSGLVLVPTVALMAVWVAYRDRNLRGLVILGAAMVAAWSMLSGWWYWRNIDLYGELFGTHMMVKVAGARPDPFTVQTALEEFEGFRWSFWGVFGLFNIVVPGGWYYSILDIVVIVAAIGLGLLLVRLVQQRDEFAVRDVLAMVLFLLAIVAVGFIAFLNWTAQTYASQGRLMFPYNAAILPLLALGLVEVARRVQPRMAFLPVGFLAAMALWIPAAVIAPQYVITRPIDDLPPEATAVYARYDQIELIGYSATVRRYTPGETVAITLYWRVLGADTRDLSLALTFVDPNGQAVGKIDSYPGTGSLRTSTWQAGEIYADRYEVRLSGDIDGRFPLRLQVGWWAYPDGPMVSPVSEAGETIGAVLLDVGAVGVLDARPPGRDITPVSNALFGDLFSLDGYQLDDDTLVLLWRVNAQADRNYTVFAQVLDDANQVVAQKDVAPTLPTRFWLPGERFITTHDLVTTEYARPGQFDLIVGWYDPSDFTRLQLTDGSDAVSLASFVIE